MTVPVPGSLTYAYLEDGVTTVFSYPVRFLEATELLVIRQAADGTRSTLTYNVDYTVSGAGDPSGGSITRTAVTNGGKIIISRATTPKQILGLEDTKRSPAEATELQLDRLAMVGQDHQAGIDRAWKALPGEDGELMPSPANGQVIGWKDGKAANIAIGSAAMADASSFATADQGVTADTAVQPGDPEALPTNGSLGQVLMRDPSAPSGRKWSPAIPGGGDMLESAYDPDGIGSRAVFAADVDASGFGFIAGKTATPADTSKVTPTVERVDFDKVQKVTDKTALAALQTASHDQVSVKGVGIFEWQSGDFTAEEDGYAVVKADDTAINLGAWVKKFYGPPRPQDFGGSDLAAVNRVLTYAARETGEALFEAGVSYTGIAGLVIPDGLKISARGAELRMAGSMSGTGDRDIVIGANCVIDDLALVRPNSGTNTYWCEIGDGARIGKLTQKADAHWAMNGVITNGENVWIDAYSGENIERHFDVLATSTSEQASGFHLGFYSARAYRRGLFLQRQKHFYIGDYHIYDRSPLDTGQAAGENAILIGGCAHGTIGDGYIAKAGEHTVRIGGDPYFNTDDLQIGDIFIYSGRGCALKINPSGPYLPDPGHARASRIKAGHIYAVDNGEGPTASNQELARVCHAYGVEIASLNGLVDAQAESGQFALVLNDCNAVRVGAIRGAFNGGISIDETADADGVDTFGGNVSNVQIDEYSGTIGGYGNILNVNMPNFAIGPISLRGIDLGGFVTNLASMNVGTYTAAVIFEGRVRGSVAPGFTFGTTTAPGDSVLVDLAWDQGRYVGRASGLAFSTKAAMQISMPAFNPADGTETTVFLNATQATSAQNAYLGAVAGSRAGSGRRAWAIAGKQTGANAFNTGLSFMVTGGVSASDALSEAMVLNHFGNLQLVKSGTGIELASPDGTKKARITLDNSGALTTTAI